VFLVIVPSLSHTHLIQTNSNEYPLQFDTRNQNIPLQQIIQDNTFFPVDLTNANNNQQDLSNNQDNQSNDSKQQYMQTFNPSRKLFTFNYYYLFLLFSFDRTNVFTKLYGRISRYLLFVL
jgi:hypothetical protein